MELLKLIKLSKLLKLLMENNHGKHGMKRSELLAAAAEQFISSGH
jgi:hypothetical protein